MQIIVAEKKKGMF